MDVVRVDSSGGEKRAAVCYLAYGYMGVPSPRSPCHDTQQMQLCCIASLQMRWPFMYSPYHPEFGRTAIDFIKACR